MKNYDQVWSKEKGKDILFHKNTQIDSGLSYKDLKNASNTLASTPSIQLKELAESQKLDLPRQFQILPTENNRITLVANTVFLGQGNFATVYSHLVIETGETLVEKVAKDDPYARKDAKNETKILTILHPGNKPVMGIEDKHKHEVFSLSSNNPLETTGFLITKYDMNLFDYITKENSQDEKLKITFQLIRGLLHLKRQGIVHGDLKLENILVRKDKDGNDHVHIADFGGAQTTDNITGVGTFSRLYIPYQDTVKCQKLIDSKDPSSQKQIIDMKEKQDVFAMGRILYELWTAENGNMENLTIVMIRDCLT